MTTWLEKYFGPAGGVQTVKIAHSESATKGKIVVPTTTEGIVTLAKTAALTAGKIPGPMITDIIRTGVDYDEITIAFGGLWPRSLTGLPLNDAGDVRLNPTDASLVRDNEISDTEWRYGYLQPTGDLHLEPPSRTGPGSSGGTQYIPVTGTHSLGSASSKVMIDVSAGGTQVLTLPNIATPGTVHEVISKGAPSGVVEVRPPSGGTIDGYATNASKTFRAMAAGFALVMVSGSLGANAWEARIPPGADTEFNARDFGHRGLGTVNDSDSITKMLDAGQKFAQFAQGTITFRIPATAGGTVVGTTVRLRWDNIGKSGGFKLVGGASVGTTPLTSTLIYVTVPTREGGAGVSVSEIITGSSGAKYARLTGFPGGTWASIDTGRRLETLGCSDSGKMNGRCLICKYVSPTEVIVSVPSTVTNGTTVGTWRSLDAGFEFWTRDCEVSGFAIYSSGAAQNLRCIFDITQSPGAGSQPLTGNVFRSIYSYASNGSTLDYVFELARNIVPEVGFTSTNGNYLDDGGGISRPVIVANVDVFLWDRCTVIEVGATKALVQCESLQKQSRAHLFENQSGAINTDSMIQCDPIFSPTLDGGYWACSIAFTADNCVVSGLTDYAFKLGYGQGQQNIFRNLSFEGLAGMLGFFHQSTGYHASYHFEGGYYMINPGVIQPFTYFFKAPSGELLLDKIEFQCPNASAAPFYIFQQLPGSIIKSLDCSFPEPSAFTGGGVYSWDATNTNAGIALVTEKRCFDIYHLVAPHRRPRRNFEDEVRVNPYAAFPYSAMTGLENLGTHLNAVKRVSLTTLPVLNDTYFRIATLFEGMTSIAVDYPIGVPEHVGDEWHADLEVRSITGSPAAGAFKRIRQRQTIYGHAIDFEAAPGAAGSNAMIVYGVTLRRVPSTVTPNSSLLAFPGIYALYKPGWATRDDAGGIMYQGSSDTPANIAALDSSALTLSANNANKPALSLSDAAFNNRPVWDWGTTKTLSIQTPLAAPKSGDMTILIIGSAPSDGGQHYFLRLRDLVTAPGTNEAGVLLDTGNTVKMYTNVGGVAKAVDSGVNPGGTKAVILCVFKAGASNAKIYVNAKTPVAGTIDTLAFDHINLGSFSASTAHQNGKSAVKAFWDRAFGQDEAAALMTAAGLYVDKTIGA